MIRFAQFKVFLVLFGAVYTICFILQGTNPASLLWGPFRYYPAISTWSIQRLDPAAAGPPILWYAWLTEAFVVTLIVSLLVPRRLADKIPAGAVWAIPVAVILGITIYERSWFF